MGVGTVAVECRGMQENAGECQGNVWVCAGRYGSGCKVPGECIEMQAGEHADVGAKCQGNVGEYQGNVWECVQSDRGMQGNAR